MKKRIKDLTLAELIKICDKQKDCEDCPLFARMNDDNAPICVDKIMNKEVEIDE